MAADTRTLVTTYFEAWRANDFARLRSVLSEDVTFRGPLGQTDGAEACVKGLQGMAQIKTDLVLVRRVVEGDDAMTWFELHTKVAPPIPVVNWSRVRDGKIFEIRATFDPRPLLAGAPK